jgi:hypothetical protein
MAGMVGRALATPWSPPLLIAAALALLSVQNTDPLAPAREGRILCYGPQADQRACEGFSRFSFEGDGRITNASVTVLASDPPITMRSSLKVYIRDGAECTMIADPADMFTAILVGDQPLQGEAFKTMSDGMAAALRENLGIGEYCTTYAPIGDGVLETITSVNGVPKPSTRNRAIWIDPNEGWRIAPRTE